MDDRRYSTGGQGAKGWGQEEEAWSVERRAQSLRGKTARPQDSKLRSHAWSGRHHDKITGAKRPGNCKTPNTPAFV